MLSSFIFESVFHKEDCNLDPPAQTEGKGTSPFPCLRPPCFIISEENRDSFLQGSGSPTSSLGGFVNKPSLLQTSASQYLACCASGKQTWFGNKSTPEQVRGKLIEWHSISWGGGVPLWEGGGEMDEMPAISTPICPCCPRS